MSNLEFFVGARIVCINDKFENIEFTHGEIVPVLGEVYTIREIIDFIDESVSFLVEEIRNPHYIYNGIYYLECSWFAWHFAPVKKTDISVFEALLNPSPLTIEKFIKEEKEKVS